MHIVILADPIDNQRAGVHTYTKNLAKEFLKISKIDTTLKLTFIHQKNNNFFENTNHHIIPRKKTPGYGTYRKFFLIPRLLKKIKPDLVLEPCHIGPFRTPKNCKRVTMIHDLTPILMPEYHIRQSTLIHQLLLKRVLKKSNLILTASQNTKRDIEKFANPAAPIKVIPLGLSTPKPTKQSTSTIKEKYLLYLGTIEPRKNLETLIQVFTALKKDHQIAHKLILAGEIGWKSEKILDLARPHPDIKITGHLNEDEKSQLLKNADIFIYPSIYEGFGLPPLEAMAQGIPVICSTGGSLKELYSSTALTYSPFDKQTLKEHIINLTTQPRLHRELSQKGINYSQNFTWSKTAEATIQALKEFQTK